VSSAPIATCGSGRVNGQGSQTRCRESGSLTCSDSIGQSLKI
jgi:hypothetical protein